jgi:hypothetical protein
MAPSSRLQTLDVATTPGVLSIAVIPEARVIECFAGPIGPSARAPPRALARAGEAPFSRGTAISWELVRQPRPGGPFGAALE